MKLRNGLLTLLIAASALFALAGCASMKSPVKPTALSVRWKGSVDKVYVRSGQSVIKGQALVSVSPYVNPLTNIVISDVVLRAPSRGRVVKLLVKLGEKVKAHQPLIVFQGS